MRRRWRRLIVPLFACLYLTQPDRLLAAAEHAHQQLDVARPAATPEEDAVLRLNREFVELYEAGRIAEAEPVAEEAHLLAGRTLASHHPEAISAAQNMALVLEHRGRIEDAENLLRKAIADSEQAGSANDRDLLTTIGNLGRLYLNQRRYTDAEPLLERLAKGREKLLGYDDPSTISAHVELAQLYVGQERFQEAEQLLVQATRSAERALGPTDPDTLFYYFRLGSLYGELGRLSEGERLLRRVLKAYQLSEGADARLTLDVSNDLAINLQRQGRYGDAERLFGDGLEVSERALGAGDVLSLAFAHGLAALYLQQGRYSDSERLFRRVLAEMERTVGHNHPKTLTARSNLAAAYQFVGRDADAEPLVREVLRQRELSLGADDPDTLMSLNNIAGLMQSQRRFDEAASFARRASEGSARVLGADHPSTLTYQAALAHVYMEQGRVSDAEAIYTRVLAAKGRVLGPEHPDTLTTAASLVAARLNQAQLAHLAVDPARVLLSGLRQQREPRDFRPDTPIEKGRAVVPRGRGFTLFADAAWAAALKEESVGHKLLPEVFAALQDSIAGVADRSMAEQAARRYAAIHGSHLPQLLREREQLEARWSRLDRELIAALGIQSPVSSRQALRLELKGVKSRLAEVDDRIRRDAPDYYSLVVPRALSVEEAQDLLGPDEAFLIAVPGPYGTHILCVVKDEIQWERSSWTEERVRAAVERLRRDLGAPLAASSDGARAGIVIGAPDRTAKFDRRIAFELMQELVKPFANLLTSKRLYVAAGGHLASLPFSLLVSEEPTGADDDPVALRDTHWLVDDLPLVHMPSMQSLAMLRKFTRPESASRSFLGVGNPALGRRAAQRKRGAEFVPVLRGLFRSGRSADGSKIADANLLRSLPRLPGTAIELEQVRVALGAPPESLLMDARATESNFRRAELKNTKIILFSTHGLLASEASGVGEAGLILTPPETPRPGDDGFLAASEVSGLDLNAEWVILSACNTATDEVSGGSGLGPLARAFFYAGARNLLASHWPVSDEVAPVLIARTVRLEQEGLSRAQAFRKAMAEIRMGSNKRADSWAHPFYWAPFVLIGDGR